MTFYVFHYSTELEVIYNGFEYIDVDFKALYL